MVSNWSDYQQDPQATQGAALDTWESWPDRDAGAGYSGVGPPGCSRPHPLLHKVVRHIYTPITVGNHPSLFKLSLHQPQSLIQLISDTHWSSPQKVVHLLVWEINP